MLIRTQDRTCICNVGNMEGILISEKPDGTALLTICFSGHSNHSLDLGTYKNIDRATEVLDGICNAYENKWKLFNMPEE